MLKIFKNKRGEISHEVYNTIFTIVILTAISLVFLTVQNSLRDQAQFKQDWLGQDLVFTLDAAQASPQNLEQFVFTKDQFPLNTFQYEFAKSYNIPQGKNSEKTIINALAISRRVSTDQNLESIETIFSVATHTPIENAIVQREDSIEISKNNNQIIIT
tara:strand:- start:195 stop:671 length:477 start_codon:yes stop_codon:yes gene_type:complete